MSVSISFRNTTKKYGDFTVIPNLSLRIEKGEFFTLLGPSGCGKTTLLRMVAGFVSIESGKIYFNEKAINDEPPGNRNIGMVFQDYALFPHLTVRENVAFGLKNRRIPRAKIYEMVDETLEIVKIAEHSDKLPERLSGGQQQRVALARAIIIQPSVLLMDEPLSNLDAMLRIEMRNAIKELQNELGITTIYVTHDQEEAMAISDRIGIMDSGVIQQIGTPREIYQKPENLFVANFIGQTNVLDGALTCDRGGVILEFTDSYRVTMNDLNIAYEKGKKMPVKTSVRPEDFTIGRNGDGMEAIIEESVFLGLNTHYSVRLETGRIVKIIRESTVGDTLVPGTGICLGVKKEKINVYNIETGINLNKENAGKEVVANGEECQDLS